MTRSLIILTSVLLYVTSTLASPPGACVSNPCQNGGVCVDNGYGGYQCNCTLTNWQGKNCQLHKWCLAASFVKTGCYKTPRPRPATTTLLFSRRDDIDWNAGWDNYLENIVFDCGKAAKDGGYRYFCIEFYGECWGYTDFDVTNAHKGGANHCWGKRPNYDTCDDTQISPVCVGTAWYGFFYELI